jgi:hypothetical protein
VQFLDGTGARKQVATGARTKAEAKKLVAELKRTAERQRHGLEPLRSDCAFTVWELCEWWLKEQCPEPSRESEKSRLTLHVQKGSPRERPGEGTPRSEGERLPPRLGGSRRRARHAQPPA